MLCFYAILYSVLFTAKSAPRIDLELHAEPPEIVLSRKFSQRGKGPSFRRISFGGLGLRAYEDIGVCDVSRKSLQLQ